MAHGDDGLRDLRSELERDPRDPLKGSVMAILAGIEPAWRAWRIGYDGRSWTAEPRAGGATIRALSPDELIAAMREAAE